MSKSGTDKNSRRDSTRNGSFYLTMETKIITVEIAREKLGKKGRKMTDKELNDLLVMLRLICNKTIDSVLENKL